MFLPCPPLLHPRVENFLLLGGEADFRIRRRHPFVRIGGRNPLDQRTFIRFAWHHDPRLLDHFSLIQPQVGLACRLVRSMAVKTLFGQNRPDIAVEIDRLARHAARLHRAEEDKQHQEFADSANRLSVHSSRLSGR